MERCRLSIVGALLLLVPVITISALSDSEKEPSPEPYSFSYQAESVGGFSSHQESGDGTGKVQGFYIIMGEDGRDRRVDYVADENGYRASISTNEVGTRSESSADAQYNARLPSQGQLNQAKVSAEEYQYLEDQHAAERERHLANSKRQQQHQEQFNFTPDRQKQQQWASSSGQNQSGSQLNGSRVWATNQQGGSWNQQQQPQQPLYERSNSSLLNEQSGDDSWRRSAKLIGSNQQRQQYASNQWLASSAPSGAQSNTDQQQQQRFLSTSSSSSSSSSSLGNNKTSEQRPQQQIFGSLASATTIGPLATALANAPAPVPQRQQAQQAAWQLADRGAAPARLPINGGNNNYLQRALEQQFMQQAYQLTDQDYPRQPIQFNSNNRQGGSVDYSQQLLTQQRPQVLANQVNDQQPLSYDNEQGVNFSSVSASYAQQRPSWQTGNYNKVNNNIGLSSTGGEFSQINQQQNNIIDEVSGEQVDAQVTNTSDDKGKGAVSGNFTTSTSTQFNQDGLKQQNNYAQQQQQQLEQRQPQFVQPITTTTTSQPAAPSGFISINLSQENSTNLQNQQLDQEVESKQPQQQQQQQSFVTNTQTTSSFGGQKTNQDQNTGDYQQVTVQQQVTNPPKQVVEISSQHQEGGSYVDSNQGKQQLVTTFQQAPEVRPDTTTQGPIEPSTMVIQQQKTQQQVFETSQAPFAEVTTTTTSQRPTIFQQYVTSTSTAPSRVPYDTSTTDTLTTSNGGGSSLFLQQTGKRPATSVKYQQTLDGGVKGSRFVGGQREFNSTFYNRFNEQPAVITGQQQVIVSEHQQRPISENAKANTTSSQAYQQSTLTSEKPEVLTGNRFVVGQTNKQTDSIRSPAQQQVPYQRPTATSFDYYNNRQQQRVTNSEIGTIPTTVGPTLLIATGLQQQPQYKGGVKGGSRTGKRQFWQQQQQQQRPLIPSGQRVFPASATRLPAEAAPSQPSVDYAASVTSYGSRISGR